MTALELLIKYWPLIVFIVGASFVLGGYAVMIAILRDQVRALFRKSAERDEQMTKLDMERAVLETELKHLKDLVTEVKGLLTSLTSQLRGGHIRQSDLKD